MNTNNWPYSAAGPDSPQRQNFPAYMDTAGENPRGIHATQLLTDNSRFTAETLRDAAFDSYLPAFAVLIPRLLNAYDALPFDSVLRVQLAEQIELLRVWDRRWALQSIATTLAVLWGDELWDSAKTRAESQGISVYGVLENHMTDTERLAALQAVSDRLRQDFGTWQVPWGAMNRFQRLNGAVVPTFTDTAASTPVAFASARWGSLASFGARRQAGTQKYYGTSGNSFVAIVEFGETVSAHAVMAGGASGDATSKHFGDQIERYATGNLREVYFYPKQLIGHTESVYTPGEHTFAGFKPDPKP
jgi:acyl-homoserine-lactone acylase